MQVQVGHSLSFIYHFPNSRRATKENERDVLISHSPIQVDKNEGKWLTSRGLTSTNGSSLITTSQPQVRTNHQPKPRIIGISSTSTLFLQLRAPGGLYVQYSYTLESDNHTHRKVQSPPSSFVGLCPGEADPENGDLQRK